jgi:acyl carrier protein
MSEQTTDRVRQRVAAAWSAVLSDADAPEPGTRFLAAGGHSLAAARLIARLGSELGVDLPMSAILRDDPRFADLVALVSGQAGSEAAVEPEPIAATPDDEPIASAPLAPTMRRLWTWHRLHPDSPAYNVVRVIEIAGRATRRSSSESRRPRRCRSRWFGRTT